MIQSFDYRPSRYMMLGLMIIYLLLMIFSFLVGNPFSLAWEYVISWIMMLVFLCLITMVHPIYRKRIIVFYVIGQLGAIYYAIHSLFALIKFVPDHALSWINFVSYGVLLIFNVLSMILPMFIFLRKDMFQKPFIVLAVAALLFQFISQTFSMFSLIAIGGHLLIFPSALRIIMAYIPFIVIILYTLEAKQIQLWLDPNNKGDQFDDDDHELFGWLTLGLYTIYHAIERSSKQ